MALNRRSRLITHGVARAPNRAMLRAVGFGDDDFEKPIVGVANGHSTMNPCNAGIQPLVDRAIDERLYAGVTRIHRAVAVRDADDRLVEIGVAEADGAQHGAVGGTGDACGDQAGTAVGRHRRTPGRAAAAGVHQ